MTHPVTCLSEFSHRSRCQTITISTKHRFERSATIRGRQLELGSHRRYCGFPECQTVHQVCDGLSTHLRSGQRIQMTISMIIEHGRCILTNIDPATGQRNPDHQPLKTLKKYRNIVPNESPVMGIHIGLRNGGRVSIGDAIYIEDKE